MGLTCTDNIAVNGAVGAVTFGIVSTQDATALTTQTGYTIIDTSLTWTSAATSSSMVTGQAPGDFVFTLGITTALANTDTLDITASQAIWSATAATSTSILRVSATGAIATGTFVLTCTDNIAVNA